MRGIFVSSQTIDGPPARALVDALHTAGIEVALSPRNPADGEDSRWLEWYSTGLPDAMRASHAAVLVLDDVWDSSTWMAEEARVAFALLGPDAVFFWNPSNVSVKAAGMLAYLKTRLPDALADAVETLRAFVLRS